MCLIALGVWHNMHSNPINTDPYTTTITLQNPGAKVFAGSCSFQRDLGSLLDDLRVNGMVEDIMICHNVMVDALVNQLAIQRNLIPLLINQYSNDTKHTPSKSPRYHRYFRGLKQTVATMAIGISS